MNLPEVEMIDKGDGLHELAACLDRADRFGVDTESNSFYVYREQVCFLQIACQGRIFVIDTLAVTQLDPITPYFSDPSKIKILHGADYDVSCLGRDFGIRFENLFDTHVAAHFLGHERLGLASLVEEFKGIVLDKSFTRYDWGRRPLNADLVRYLSDDVVHLDDLHDLLLARLEDADLVEEAELEFQRVSRQEWTRMEVDPEGFRRIKGAAKLDHLGLSILRHLYLWREGRAERINVPPFRILGNRQLLDISDARPRTLHDLERRARVSPKIISRYGRELLDCVHQGLETWQEIPLRPKKKSRRSLNGNVVAEAIKQWRRERAAKRDCPPIVVLPNHALESLLDAWPRTPEELLEVAGLGPKRCERYGAALLGILERFPKHAPKAG